MTVTSEGLRIELLESQNGTFFESGDTDPNGNGRELLMTIAEELGKIPNKISVEGHTDSATVLRAARTIRNWELSADRANASRRLMQQHGLRADQVAQVRGFADQEPRERKGASDPSNRRITLIVTLPGAERCQRARQRRSCERNCQASRYLPGSDGRRRDSQSAHQEIVRVVYACR